MEQCVVSDSMRVLENVLQDDTVKWYTRVATESLYPIQDAYQPRMDVSGVCDRCGAQGRGQLRWSPTTMEFGWQWTTLNYAGTNPFPNKQHHC